MVDSLPGRIAWGVIIQRTDNVALVYAVSGLLTCGIAPVFFLTPLGHTERYLLEDKKS